MLIDFNVVGGLQTLLRLPFRWVLPNLLTDELVNPSVGQLQAMGVEMVRLEGEALVAVSRLRADHPRLSLADCAILVLAHQEQALVLSGDKLLVEVAKTKLKLETHGTLWALEQLVRHGIVGRDEARQMHEAMLRAGRRLPR